MFSRSALRIALVLGFGIAAFYSPGYAGWRWGIDGWLWTGYRTLLDRRPEALYLPLIVSGAMVLAELLGFLCPAVRPEVRRPRLWAINLFAVAVALLWLGRVHHWLGDLHGIDRSRELPWWMLEAAEPLGALTFYLTMHAAAALSVTFSSAVAAVSVVSGAAAIVALFLWSRLEAKEWPLVLAMLLSSGFVVLFLGYPEKGTPKALALLCWYVYCGSRELRQRRGQWNVLASSLLSLAILMHGSALCWLPAHAWCIWRGAGRSRAAGGVAAFAAPMAPIAILWLAGAPRAGGPWGNIAAPWQWFKEYCISNCGYDFWSATHFLDVLNCLLLLSPVAALCLPEALWRGRRRAEQRWLALATLGCLGLSLTWFPVFGYLGDWDIFTGAPLAASLLAITVGREALSQSGFRRFACVWIAGTLPHTLSLYLFFQVVLR